MRTYAAVQRVKKHCIPVFGRKIKTLWRAVTETYEKIMSKEVPITPKPFLLGLHPKNTVSIKNKHE